MGPKGMKWSIGLALTALLLFSAGSVQAQVVNTPPTTIDLQNFSVDEDSPATVISLWNTFADAQDADNLLVYAVVSNTNSTLVTTSIDPATGNLSLSYALNGNGSATITVRATDTGSGSTPLFVDDSFVVTVNPINDKPTTSGIPPVTVDEDAATLTIDLTLAFADVDNTYAQLTFTRTGHTNPPLLDAYIASGSSLVLDFAPNAFGTTIIAVSATDPGGLSETTSFLVTVNPVNDIPTTSGLANVSVLEDAANTVIDLWPAFADIEDTDAQMTYSVVSTSNPALFDALPILGGQNLILDYKWNANGVGTITVRATDTGGLSAQTTFSVNVTPVNDAPVAVGDVYSVKAGQSLAIPASGIIHNDYDVELDPLTAVFLSPPQYGEVFLNGDGAFTYVTPSYYFYGTVSFQYLVTDGDLKSNPARVVIQISPVDNILSKPYSATEGVRWVPIKGGRTERLSCVDEEGKILILGNKDAVEFLGCLDVGRGWIAPIAQESLPGPLPAGTTYVSAFKIGVTIKGILQTYLNGGMILMFHAPEAGSNYAILFWDPDRGANGGWVELPPYGQTADIGNGRKVFSGVRYYNGNIVSTINMTGSFALVRK